MPKPYENKRKITKITLYEKPKKKIDVIIEEEEIEDKKLKQIVDLPKDESAEAPDDAKYLSESNHKVEKETVSKYRRPTDIPAHELFPGDQPEQREYQAPQEERNDPVPFAEGEGPPRNLKDINLVPDIDTMLKNFNKPGRRGGAPSNDAITGVEEGEGTFLNTKEFKYASYFNRIKRDVTRVWNPANEWKREDPTGQLYGHIQKKTLLRVVLDAEGAVLSVKVSKSSTIEFLDKAAVAAFWHCVQFPNPPKGLIVDNKIDFYFGFVVDFNPSDVLEMIKRRRR
jgi:TonB family protein